jgi:hypothetical protein
MPQGGCHGGSRHCIGGWEILDILLGSVLLSEARIRYSRGSAMVTTGRYEFWSSNAIWNRIGVGGQRRSGGLRVGEGQED